ncbi:helix-turn-helix domain-containing protein [Streptomyces longwoodensis]|uniref:helix-turn-helix domain-containing protein n=1 Tax=Streptomyces longwoodensis TaxID=68231 RepID=UPI002DD82530|nr:helix-turn-helix transcriptional regulator [Streptomyces longwoodensis]WRY88829.1 helix-turn-helix domain-containing protein [Streptomyces longwoodensis]
MPLDPLPDWVLTRRRQIGERIRAQRLHAGLTQLALADRIGRDHRTVHRWEYATAEPSLTDLLLLAAALDTTVGQILDEG